MRVIWVAMTGSSTVRLIDQEMRVGSSSTPSTCCCVFPLPPGPKRTHAMCSLIFPIGPTIPSLPTGRPPPPLQRSGCSSRRIIQCMTLVGFSSQAWHPSAAYLPTMTHPYFTRSKLLPSRRNYEGYIPRTCTMPTLLISPSLSPSILCTTSALPISAHLTSSDAPQRSDEWFALRKDKLTTSTFSTALGFWRGNRRSELWHQKVFEPEADSLDAAARAAMSWGVNQEYNAIEQYKIITGRDVGSLGFAVHTEAKFGWLGASPDGLLGCHPDGGILEVKCPYNKGKPELGLPWQAVPYYYMPQVQGQMEIMDRDWVDLYCWTPNGSALFRVVRDREYWELMLRVLGDFWWGSVVPAREAVMAGKEEVARSFEPKPKHGLTGLVIGRSRKMAGEARLLCRDIGGHVEFFR